MMIQRVRFLTGAAAAAVALPGVAIAKPDPSPAPDASPKATHKPHVHGPNGVVVLPEHRPIEWWSDVLDGPEFRLSKYRGKPVFVNVFATWCGPCRVEQPTVVEFARAHADEIIVVGVDVAETDNDVRAYRKKYAIPYPIAMDREDRSVRRIYRAGRMVFPTTVVFRADGTLSCAWPGDVDRAWFERELQYALQPVPPPEPQPS